MLILNAENLILGRMATYVAKKILLNEEVIVVNCEKAIITGNKKDILEKYQHRRRMGVPAFGPFFPRSPERIVRRTIRGMIPWKQARGKEAFRKVKCYRGIPDVLKDKEMKTIEKANVSKIKNLKYMTIGELSKHLGVK